MLPLRFGIVLLFATVTFAETFFQSRDYNIPPDFDGNLSAISCDIEGDGDQDVITTAVNDVMRFYINTGDDLNGDGFPEFVNEDWRCNYNTYSPDSLAECIVRIDGNDDVFPDLFVGTSRNWGHGGLNNVMLINDGTGRFFVDTLAVPRKDDRTHSIVVADLNSDGLDDIIVGNGEVSADSVIPERSYVLLNSGLTNDPSSPGSFVDASNTSVANNF